MAAFEFQAMFPHGDDTTPYRRLDGQWISTDTFCGEPVLVVDAAALTRLAFEAVRDVSHLFRPGHLRFGSVAPAANSERRQHRP